MRIFACSSTKATKMQSVSPEYKVWLVELKQKIRSVQLKAAVAVNAALIDFYWELGRMISEKDRAWGSKLIEQVACDLKDEFPGMTGLSRRNLFNMKKFYEILYTDSATACCTIG